MGAGAEPRIRPQFLIIGGVALVVIVVLLLVNVLGGDGGEVAPGATPGPGAIDPSLGVPPLPTDTPRPVENPDLEVIEIFEGRDPFRTLVIERPEAPPTDPDATPLPPGVTPAPGATPAPGVTPAPAPGTPAPTQPPTNRVRISVLAVSDSKADVQVNGRKFDDVKAGSKLSHNITVKFVGVSCVVFTRNGEEFRLCEGESIIR